MPPWRGSQARFALPWANRTDRVKKYGNQGIPVGMKSFKYEQIKAGLIEDIETGRVKENGRIPSEIALVQQWRVSPVTVSKTLTQLEEEGYLIRRVGDGTYVQGSPTDQPTAFFALDDFLAIHALQYCQDHGLAVPDEMAARRSSRRLQHLQHVIYCFGWPLFSPQASGDGSQAPRPINRRQKPPATRPGMGAS